MIQKIILGGVIALCCSSCLMYKDISPNQTAELQKTARSSENLQIPDDWILNRENQIDFSYDWIIELKDPQLKTLIDDGLKYNADIIIAKEKLDQIELAMQIAGSNLYPTVNAVANTSNNLVKGSHIQNLALKASWELDIWGKNKAGHKANMATYFSAKYQNERLKQSIITMIGKAYFLSIAIRLQQDKVARFLQSMFNRTDAYRQGARAGAGLMLPPLMLAVQKCQIAAEVMHE